MPSQKNSIWKNLAARHALFLTSVDFFFPKKTPFVSSKHTTENCNFSPEVFLIKNTFEKYTLLRALVCTRVHAGHPSNVPVGFPDNVLLFFEGTVQNFTETNYLQERGLICWCSSSHKDIRLSQLFSPVVSGC